MARANLLSGSGEHHRVVRGAQVELGSVAEWPRISFKSSTERKGQSADETVPQVRNGWSGDEVARSSSWHLSSRRVSLRLFCKG